MSAEYSKWLIVSDIDGTLNNKLRRLPEINKTKIKDSTIIIKNDSGKNKW